MTSAVPIFFFFLFYIFFSHKWLNVVTFSRQQPPGRQNVMNMFWETMGWFFFAAHLSPSQLPLASLEWAISRPHEQKKIYNKRIKRDPKLFHYSMKWWWSFHTRSYSTSAEKPTARYIPAHITYWSLYLYICGSRSSLLPIVVAASRFVIGLWT